MGRFFCFPQFFPTFQPGPDPNQFWKPPESLRAQRLKKFNLAWNSQSRLKISISIEIFNLALQNFPQKIGPWWVARLKFSISLESFKILNFFNLWALGDYDRPDQLQRLRMPDLENSRKSSRKRCRVGPRQVPGKQPKNSRKKTPEACKTTVFQLFGCPSGCFFWLFSRHFAQGPLATFFGCFLAVFKVRRSGPL